jgi:hypothetical protein
MTYALPKLPYAYDALEPHIDAQTMEIHYTGAQQRWRPRQPQPVLDRDVAPGRRRADG